MRLERARASAYCSMLPPFSSSRPLVSSSRYGRTRHQVKRQRPPTRWHSWCRSHYSSLLWLGSCFLDRKHETARRASGKCAVALTPRQIRCRASRNRHPCLAACQPTPLRRRPTLPGSQPTPRSSRSAPHRHQPRLPARQPWPPLRASRALSREHSTDAAVRRQPDSRRGASRHRGRADRHRIGTNRDCRRDSGARLCASRDGGSTDRHPGGVSQPRRGAAHRGTSSRHPPTPPSSRPTAAAPQPRATVAPTEAALRSMLDAPLSVGLGGALDTTLRASADTSTEAALAPSSRNRSAPRARAFFPADRTVACASAQRRVSSTPGLGGDDWRTTNKHHRRVAAARSASRCEPSGGAAPRWRVRRVVVAAISARYPGRQCGSGAVARSPGAGSGRHHSRIRPRQRPRGGRDESRLQACRRIHFRARSSGWRTMDSCHCFLPL